MSGKLAGRSIAVLATHGVEQSELTEPIAKLEAAGASVELVSLSKGTIQATNHMEKGKEFEVTHTLEDVAATDFEALVLPGGVHNPDTLRTDERATDFVRDFSAQHKPVAAICHGPWLLVEAGVVKGKKLTSWPSLKTDLRNAGAEWVDEECVCDHGLVTSRNPGDLPAFCAKMVEEFAKGPHRLHTP